MEGQGKNYEEKRNLKGNVENAMEKILRKKEKNWSEELTLEKNKEQQHEFNPELLGYYNK